MKTYTKDDLDREISLRYSEPWRKYHTLKHIQNMFKYASEFKVDLTSDEKYAIKFHDIVYCPGSPYNEYYSAQLVDYFREKYTLPIISERVKNIILTTKTHKTTNIHAYRVIDLDLYELSDSIKYKQNKLLIRQEYCMYSDKEFKESRLSFLKEYSSRSKLFLSDIFSKDVERRAKENMLEEIVELTNG